MTRSQIRRGFRSAVTVVTVAALSAGCYTYAPIDPRRPALQSEVRIVLAEETGAHLATYFDGRTPGVEGRVLESNADEVVLRITPSERWMGAASAETPTIRVPRESIVRMDVKRIDTLRTALIAGGFIAVLGIVLAGRLDDTGYKGEQIPMPPTDAGVVPAY